MIRILLAEDMHMVRGALVALLRLEDDLEVTQIGAVGAPAAERAQVLVIMELPSSTRSPSTAPSPRLLKRSGMTDGYGIPLGCVLAGANRHDSPLLAPTLDRLDDLGPLPDDITAV